MVPVGAHKQDAIPGAPGGADDLSNPISLDPVCFRSVCDQDGDIQARGSVCAAESTPFQNIPTADYLHTPLISGLVLGLACEVTASYFVGVSFDSQKWTH